MTSFSLLSLNTFGVPFYLSLGRIKRLALELNRIAPSLICLQEIQQNAYLPLLQHNLTAFSHLAYFRNRFAPKGGLFTASVSAHPIVKSYFYPFPNQGHLLSIGFSDWALNKGILMTNLEVDKRCFVVMNTHLQANYLGDWRQSNSQAQIQLEQVKYLGELIRAQPNDAWVIVCGDFNFPRHSPAYQQMISQSGLVDAHADDPKPTYQPFPLISTKWRTSLDFIFYQKPIADESVVTADIIPVVNSTAHQAYQRFLTDHHALVLTIR
jgi:endonuclease/exonuclease/phosphatase family metal-dependent hydrolase